MEVKDETRDDSEHQPARRPASDDSPTGRLEAFSDGVFAVAITLLVLEVKVPFDGNNISNTSELIDVLLKQWPTYFGYILSFIVIGITWMGHHVMFNYIERVDRILMIFNLLLLMIAAFVPFTTALLVESLDNHVGETLSAVIYSGTLFVQGIIWNLMWRYAAQDFRLLDKSANREHVARLTRSYIFWPLLYAASMIVSFFSVWASLAIYILLPLSYFRPSAADRYQEV